MLFQKDIYDGYIKKIDRKKKEVNENKKERKRSLKKSVLQFPPISGDFLKPSEKVSFCTFLGFCRRASLAVETALVLPLFFLGMVTMISFMDIYQIQHCISRNCVKRRKMRECMRMYWTGKVRTKLLCRMYIPRRRLAD